MTDEKKIIKGLDKELMQLIDAEMNDPVLGKLLNRNAAYVLGKEIKLLFIEKACKWLEENLAKETSLLYSGIVHVNFNSAIRKFKQAMKGD